jgi:hypothetical protein
MILLHDGTGDQVYVLPDEKADFWELFLFLKKMEKSLTQRGEIVAWIYGGQERHGNSAQQEVPHEDSADNSHESNLSTAAVATINVS